MASNSSQLNTKLVVCGSAAAALVGYLSYLTWKNIICQPSENPTDNPPEHSSSSDDKMGQSASSNGGYVVEIAPPKLSNGWQLVPQDEEPPPTTRQPPPQHWRITVNPQSDVETPTIQRVESPTSAEEESDGEVETNKKFKIKRVVYDGTQSAPLKSAPKSISPNSPVRLPKMQLFACMQGFSGDEFKQRLNTTVEKLYGVSKVLAPEEAKCLVLMLELREPSDTLLRTLTTISNLAAFTTNQDLLRDFGCISCLKQLLNEHELPNAVKVMLVQAVANMAVNVRNQELLQESIPVLIKKLSAPLSSELERIVCIQALTNLSVQIRPNRVRHFAAAIPYLYRRLWIHGKVNLAVLKLLINLSCSTDLVPYLLAAKAPPGIQNLLNQHQSEDVLVRSTSLFVCLCSTVDSLGLTWSDLSHLCHEPSVSEIQSVYFAIFGPVGSFEVPRRLKILKSHPNEEIAHKSARIIQILQNIIMNSNDSRCSTAQSDQPSPSPNNLVQF